MRWPGGFSARACWLRAAFCVNPKCAPSVVANNFKTVTSRLLRKEFPALRAKYREPVLWNQSYFVASVGGGRCPSSSNISSGGRGPL